MGADKISINTPAIENPKLISELANEFGSQCVVASVDAKQSGKEWTCFSNSGTKDKQINVISWCKRLEELGAGEILITSIDKDGTEEGFDFNLLEKVSDWFNYNGESPYMLMVANVKKDKQINMNEDQKKLFGIEKLNIKRSEVPAITHVDYSARVQTVNKKNNKRYYDLISKFKEKTGCALVVNTSFNVRGEPIVCTPKDAYLCFMRTEMDILVLENQLLFKSEQPKLEKDQTWMQEFELD